MDLRSALSDDDTAGKDVLPVSSLDTEAFALAVTAVLGGTAALFMCEKL
jgi:hypothetical protein